MTYMYFQLLSVEKAFSALHSMHFVAGTALSVFGLAYQYLAEY